MSLYSREISTLRKENMRLKEALREKEHYQEPEPRLKKPFSATPFDIHPGLRHRAKPEPLPISLPK